MYPQTWDAAKKEASTIKDKLGKPIDEEILLAVAALRFCEYPTRGSCAGHESWGRGYPWVEIGIEEPSKDRMLILWGSVSHLLRMFYADRLKRYAGMISYEAILVLERPTTNHFTIRPIGGPGFKECLSEGIRTNMILEARNEFLSFAEFIVERQESIHEYRRVG
jgi:hypothetical protein